jgi:anti-sigma regulatory factor (Ser/Thr protein kinase)
VIHSRSRPLLSLSTRIEPDAEALRLVRTQLRSLLHDRGWAGTKVDEILLGLDEALMNACFHGGCVERGEAVEFGVELFHDRVVFEVSDRGDFTPKNGRDPAPLPRDNDEAESGRGLFLVQNTMDEVRYERREGGGTRVRLVKRR